MTKFYLVTSSGGDGSYCLEWVTDENVIRAMHKLADEGDETYATGDGLAVREIVWPDSASVSLEEWFKINKISVTTMEDLMEYR